MSLAANEGTTIALVGESGSGKSTLARCLALGWGHWGDAEPLSGHLRSPIGNRDVTFPGSSGHGSVVQEVRFFCSIAAQLGRKILYPGAPYLFSGTPWRAYRRPPLVGEHTSEILGQDLGMKPGEIETLAAEGVI